MFRQITILLVLVFFMIGSAFAADKWVVQNFESQAQGVGAWSSGWGGSKVGNQVWAADTSGLSAGALKMSIDASLGASGDHKAAFSNGNLSVIVNGDTATTMTFDVWVPSDFPSDGNLQVFGQDRVNWAWESDTYGGANLNLGDWTTVSFDIASRVAAGRDISDGLQAGIEFYFADGTVWTGAIFADNITLSGVRNPAEEILADFEVEALGANGWNSGWGDSRVGSPTRIADPIGTGGSTGVLEMQMNPALGAAGGHNACFANESVNFIIEGDTAHTLQMDVYLPADLPTGGGLQIFAQDRTNWAWHAVWSDLSALTLGAWNTLTFDIQTTIAEDPLYLVGNGVKCGVEVKFNSADSATGWTGSLYADNIKLIGVHKVVTVALESPAITAVAMDTVLNATTGTPIYEHIIEWTDLSADMGETYNIYMSKSAPITDVLAADVILISEQVPRGTQIWHERPETVDGSQVELLLYCHSDRHR